jgi:hypothetical protein
MGPCEVARPDDRLRDEAIQDCRAAWIASLTLAMTISSQRMSFTHSSSVSTVTPSFFASVSLEPAPGPATT